MIYEYHCDNCNTNIFASRAVADRDQKPDCNICAESERTGDVRRVISRPYLTCNRFVDRAENKNPFGLSAIDQVRKMKADDKAYQAQWEGVKIDQPREKSAHEILADYRAGRID